MPDALGELTERLRGTPMELALGDAALEIIEHCNEDEMEIVRSTPWAKAPNAFERMLGIVERPRQRLSDVWLVELYGELLRLRPTDPRLLEAFTRDASKRSAPTSLLSLAARYNLDWLVEHLPALRPPVSVDMRRWVTLAGSGDNDADAAVLESNRARLLTAISQLGEPYVAALVAQVKRPPIPQDVMRALHAHPNFANRL
jgi:hypothetical protein